MSPPGTPEGSRSVRLVRSGAPPVRTASWGTTLISKNTRLTMDFPGKRSSPLCRGRSSSNDPDRETPLRGSERLPLFVITKHSNREGYPVGDVAAEDHHGTFGARLVPLSGQRPRDEPREEAGS